MTPSFLMPKDMPASSGVPVTDPVRSEVRADAPFSENGETDGSVLCTRCGLRNESGDHCAKCGGYLPKNAAAVTWGGYRHVQPADMQMTAAELVAGVVADLGGLGELSTLERKATEHIGSLSVLLRLLADDIVARGLFTPGGNPRRSYDALLAGLDRFDRLTQRLGLKRRARSVPSLQDYIASRAEGPSTDAT